MQQLRNEWEFVVSPVPEDLWNIGSPAVQAASAHVPLASDCEQQAIETGAAGHAMSALLAHAAELDGNYSG